MSRSQRHALLDLSNILLLAVAAVSGPATGIEDRLSIVSAYLCFALLSCTLLVGLAQVVMTRKPIVSSYMRRDIGIWSALVGLLHFVLANKL